MGSGVGVGSREVDAEDPFADAADDENLPAPADAAAEFCVGEIGMDMGIPDMPYIGITGIAIIGTPPPPMVPIIKLKLGIAPIC